MQSSADALALIGHRVGHMPEAGLVNGLKIDIENVVHVKLMPASSDSIRMIAQLDEFDGDLNDNVMETMLKANAFGEGTGAARLSLEADNRPALSMDLDVALHDESTLVESVIAFMNYAAYWQSIGTDILAEAGNGRRNQPDFSSDWDDVMLVRI